MAEQIPSGQEPQPSAEDVVVFSPELLKLAKQRQEHLEECRQAADSGDCAAAVQMGVNYLYGTGGVQKDPEQAFYWFSQSAPDDPVGLYWQAVCYDSGTGVEADEHRACSTSLMIREMQIKTTSPCVVTVCADVHRFSKWCEQRDADPAYDNFAWFLNASTDALLAAQNLCVEAEMHGLGICYLGTTIYTAGDISRILELPKGVIPVTTVVMGYPDESPALTDRLPLEAVVHYEKYTDYTAAEIDELWAEREESDLTKRLLEENGLPNLAKIFTERRYVRKDNLAISKSYFALLKEKGFFNN